MSTVWKNENIVADHRDLQANTMAVDSSGQFAVLAGRRHMGIVNLDQPTEVVYKTNRHSKWDVTTAAWSPHHQQCFALACNQRAELYSWENSEVKQTASLKAHARAISDLNWSIFDSYILATASIDTFIYLWDTRDTRKPSLSFFAVAGASQVKWNKLKSHLIATSHEGDARIWDIRKLSLPVQYITAHLNKIHNIDWCPNDEKILATSSQDCTVKFWDVTSSVKLEDILQAQSPVWRAQYTPFGSGLVTVVVPPLRRGDNSLLLWNTKNFANPVYTFFGHSDVVVEFGWRKPSPESRNFQLVTYSRDHYLRTWVVDNVLLKNCGHIVPEEDVLDALLDSQDTASQASMTSNRETEAGIPSSPPQATMRSRDKNGNMRFVPSTPQQPQNLQQEFSLVNLNIPNIDISEMDAAKRTCTVHVDSGKYSVGLKMLFPLTYPNNTPPSFQFCKLTNIDDEMKNKIIKVLKMVSHQQVRRNRSCLEPCVRQVVSTLESLTTEDKSQPQLPESPFHADLAKAAFNVPNHYGYQDISVPFPRTSGARFCGADMLVVFTRPSHLQRINAPTDDTPRSLSALSAYLSSHVVLPIKGRTASSSPAQYNLVYPPLAQSPSDTSVSISSFYHQDRKQKKRRNLQDRRSSGAKQLSNSGAVLIYSISKLMPINYSLAQNYVFGSEDIVGTCSKNAAIAAKEGCRDLVQVWSMASLIGNPTLMSSIEPGNDLTWAQHPFGREALKSLIFHYGNHYDVQTAAMLACIFHVKAPENKLKKVVDIGSSGNASPGGSPYHTVVPSNNTFEGWSIVGAALKRNRSNSWSDSVEEYSFFDDHTNRNGDFRDEEREAQEASSKLLDPRETAQLDQYKMVYADVLYRWNLLEQRAQVLKTVSSSAEKHRGVDFINECRFCKKDVTGPQCPSCKKYCFSCVICGVAVKGCSSFCMVCGHGGHTTHMQEWFDDMEVCPSGCGCKCLEANDVFGI